MMSKKVYCKDCDGFRKINALFEIKIGYIFYCTKKIYQDLEGIHFEKPNPVGCQYYKKLWWKFWK